MWLGFELLESGLNIGLGDLILIVLSILFFIFSAKGIELALMIDVVLYPCLVLWYYAMQWTYQTPIGLTLLCVIGMALIVNRKASGETII